MPLQMAFGITVRDIRTVLAKNAGKIVCQSDLSDDVLATKLFHSFSEEEMDDIALAAMDAFLEDKPEAEGAHREIRKILIKRGILDVSRRASSRQTVAKQGQGAMAMAAVHG